MDQSVNCSYNQGYYGHEILNWVMENIRSDSLTVFMKGVTWTGSENGILLVVIYGLWFIDRQKFIKVAQQPAAIDWLLVISIKCQVYRLP